LVSAAMLIALAAGSTVAKASQLHAFSSAFGSSGSGAGQVSLLPMNKETEGGRTVWAAPGSGVAVDRANGHVYVSDSGNHRIDEFEPDGTFVRAFGWEVNATSPEAKLQTCTAFTGCQAGSSGSEPGQLGSPVFIVADNDPSSPSFGDIYVAAGVGARRVDERQTVEVEATGGTFTLTFKGQTT